MPRPLQLALYQLTIAAGQDGLRWRVRSESAECRVLVADELTPVSCADPKSAAANPKLPWRSHLNQARLRTEVPPKSRKVELTIVSTVLVLQVGAWVEARSVLMEEWARIDPG